MFKVLIKESTGTLVLLNENSSDYRDYTYEGFTEMYSGTRRDCLRCIDEYFDENFVPDESRNIDTDTYYGYDFGFSLDFQLDYSW